MTERPLFPASRGARAHGLAGQPRVAALWLGKISVSVAWLGLFLALVTPPHGSGFSVCWFQSTLGVPCVGCGLTRSLSCGLRGMTLESWHYHPMGLLILALFGFTALQSLWPLSLRVRLADFIEARAWLFKALYVTFVTAFITFGAARALYHCCEWLPRWAQSF